MMKREKNISVKIIFDRKRTATKASSANRKKAAVVIEVYYDGSRIFLPTNVKIFFRVVIEGLTIVNFLIIFL